MPAFLGVPVMDRDHDVIVCMFGEFANAPDGELRDRADAIASEIRDHFAREENAMAEAMVPILHCHLELHVELLRELEIMREEIARGDAATARRLFGRVLPHLIENHVETADAASARFLRE
jgi:hemerythrin-like metal-binding protein